MSEEVLDRLLLPWAEEAEPFTELQLHALVVRHAGASLGASVLRWTRSAERRGLLEPVEWSSGRFHLVTEAGQRRRDLLVARAAAAPRLAA